MDNFSIFESISYSDNSLGIHSGNIDVEIDVADITLRGYPSGYIAISLRVEMACHRSELYSVVKDRTVNPNLKIFLDKFFILFDKLPSRLIQLFSLSQLLD